MKMPIESISSKARKATIYIREDDDTFSILVNMGKSILNYRLIGYRVKKLTGNWRAEAIAHDTLPEMIIPIELIWDFIKDAGNAGFTVEERAHPLDITIQY